MNRRSILKLAGAGALSAALPAPCTSRRRAIRPAPSPSSSPGRPAAAATSRCGSLADALSKKINVPVVVVNKAGAGGAIGHREIVTAKPDGQTIGMFSSGGIALPYMNAQANTTDEMEPLAFFGEDPNALEVSIASGINSLKEYVERARANPGKLRNGNDAPGGSSFLAIAQYERAMNFKVTRVSYGGFAPTVTALLGAEIDSATVPIPDTIEHHKGGKLKILGVSANERHYLAPDVPTFKEQGFDVVVGSWRCVIGPKGMPADRIAFLESNLLAVLERSRIPGARRSRPASSSGRATPRRRRRAGSPTTPRSIRSCWRPGLVKARQK